MEALRQWAQSADPALFWAIVAALLAAGGFGLFQAFGRWRRLRLVEDVPTSRIRSAAQGYVELSGTARMLPGHPVIAPLTGMHCVWYAFKVEKRHTTGSGSNRRAAWRTVRAGVSDETFAIEDGTGRCVVDPEGAEVHPSVRQVWEDSAPLSVLTTGSVFQLSGADRYRYTEERIHDGDPIHALGEFRTLAGADQGTLREDVAALLRQWKRSPEHFLRPFDADGNGEIYAAEWEAVRAAAEQQALRERAERAREHAVVHLLARPRVRRLPFIIATEHQDALLARLRRLMWLFWALGATGVLAAAILLTLRR
jgi:hypothetical protein